MDMHRWSLLAVAALLVAGCAAMPQQHNVKEVRICNAADCDAASQKYSVGQLLNGFAQLLKTNEGENVTICSSNPKTRACESVGFCYFVLGGILPGNGCSKSIAFSERKYRATGANMPEGKHASHPHMDAGGLRHHGGYVFG